MARVTIARRRRRIVEHRWTSEKYRRRSVDAPVACFAPSAFQTPCASDRPNVRPNLKSIDRVIRRSKRNTRPRAHRCKNL
ncbi:hypothetical protein CA603_34480 [Paraburkholderia hospita]|nr:hypothetical protein CA603_34480 [Paraburkholderia hospita]